MMHRLLIATFLLTCAAAAAAEIEAWDGSVATGEIRYEQKTGFELKSDKKTERRQLKDVFEIRWGAASRSGFGSRVALMDGSFLAGEIGPTRNLENLTLERPGGERLQLPGASVRLIEMNPLEAGKAPGDLPPTTHAVMTSGDVVACEIEWLTYLEIGVRTDAGRLRLKRGRVHRLALQPLAERKNAQADVRVRTSMGDVALGTLVGLDEQHLTLALPLGQMLFPVRALFSLENLDPRVDSLLDRKPERVEETPYLDFIRPHRIDRSLLGGPLVVQGVPFDRGIAMHSRTRMSWNTGGRYRRFSAMVGLDTSLTDRGVARFVIRGDGKELQSLLADGGMGLQTLSADITGVKQLELVLDFGPDGSGGDHGIWGNPRLIR